MDPPDVSPHIYIAANAHYRDEEKSVMSRDPLPSISDSVSESPSRFRRSTSESRKERELRRSSRNKSSGDPPGVHEKAERGNHSSRRSYRSSATTSSRPQLPKLEDSVPSLDPVSISISTADYSVPAGRSERSVTFNSVEVREHGYTLGSRQRKARPTRRASPPPVDLSWDAHSVSISTLDEYEATRGPRRPPKSFIKSDEQRRNLLKNAGFASEEIDDHDDSSDEEEESSVHTEEKKDDDDASLDVSFYEEFQKKVRKDKKEKKKKGGFMSFFRRRSSKSMGALSEM